MRNKIAAFFFVAAPVFAQAVCGLEHPGLCVRDIAKDQAGLWLSPLHAKPKTAKWLVPLAGTVAAALHYDVWAEKHYGLNQNEIATSKKIAAFGSPYATVGSAVGIYLLGRGIHSERIAKTGRLGTEAVVDSLLVVGALKMATNRQGVDSGAGEGGFWPHGTSSFKVNSSFPSGHSAVSWALASAVATQHRRNRPVQIAAYAFAAAISVSRVTGRVHFPSDVLVGSALGYFIGGYVARHRE